MCETEFGGARIALPVAERQQVVADLRGEGLSTRAIASAVGVAQGTVRNDLSQLSNSAQLPDTVTGLDGKQRPATAAVTTTVETVDVETGEVAPIASAARGAPPQAPPPPTRRRPAWRGHVHPGDWIGARSPSLNRG